jgi:hypothetical protein
MQHGVLGWKHGLNIVYKILFNEGKDHGVMEEDSAELTLKFEHVLEKIRTLRTLEDGLREKGIRQGSKCNPEDIATAERIGFINPRLEKHIEVDMCGFCTCLAVRVKRERLIDATNKALDALEKEN